ncbi:MAG: class I SAM-dependent methyltransferase [Limisphaerales bacterium]
MALAEKLFKAFHEKNAIQRHIARRFLFDIFQRFGLHITGDHFYEIIPNTRLITEKYSELPRNLPGIDWRLADCDERALDLINHYGAEFFESSTRFGFQEKNFYFRGADALMLYLVLREAKPKKLIEIGQGFSTRIILAALEKNASETGAPARLISIDPYPRLKAKDFPETVSLELIQREVQDVEMVPLLKDCDFLFVDSSHAFKFGSDVAFEFTALYPHLQKNTLLHLHDIFSPYDYPRDWMVKDKRFWNEQYVLECFLMFNSAFEIHLPVHLLVRQSKNFAQAVRGLRLDENFQFRGGSFYLKRI